MFDLTQNFVSVKLERWCRFYGVRISFFYYCFTSKLIVSRVLGLRPAHKIVMADGGHFQKFTQHRDRPLHAVFLNKVLDRPTRAQARLNAVPELTLSIKLKQPLLPW